MTDKNQEQYKIIQLIEEIIRSGYDIKISTEISSYDFALSALKGALFINAGALVALPAYHKVISNIDIFCPSILFSIGIITSALSMFFAYKNLQYYSEFNYLNGNIRASKILLNYEQEMNLPICRRKKEIEEYEEYSSKIRKKVDAYFWLSNIFGFLSYVLFILRFILSARGYFNKDLNSLLSSILDAICFFYVKK